ncbi:MAG: hypothetical protein CSA62_01800 [Planctomycetota bacterium]|nr:MAG: hypothetical protein CSA62_01800 [Planctomycetota bacterium]
MRIISTFALAACTLLGAELRAQEKAPQKPAQAKAKRIQRKAALISRMPTGKAPTQEEYKAKLASKLQEPWLKKASWVLDFEAAKQLAQEKKKLIFAYFTRSYAP